MNNQTSRFIGGMLLIIGTSIGGAMLALPVKTADAGFLDNFLLAVACWLTMTFTALCILEVNFWLPEGRNLVSMSRKTLGRGGAFIAWFVYLILLYSLLAAYIASGADVFETELPNIIPNIVSADAGNIQIKLPFLDMFALSRFQVSLLFLAVLGFIVYKGVKFIDTFNRLFMILKVGSYIALVIFLFMHIDFSLLKRVDHSKFLSATPLFITSFSFATIVPSLRSYFNNDVKRLRKAIVVGSFIPLTCYTLWILAVLGAIPFIGEHSLTAIQQSDQTTKALTDNLLNITNSNGVILSTHIFISVCVLTSFLGVALCLSDFLADGLKVKKQGFGNLIIYSATFLPPLFLVFFYPNIFIQALEYAGILCVILLALLPLAMVWSGRYVKNLSGEYQVAGGKTALSIFTVLSLIALIICIQMV